MMKERKKAYGAFVALHCAYKCRIACIAPCCTGVRLGFMDFFTHICVQKLDGKSAKYEIPMVYFFDLTCAASSFEVKSE
jgi:hypothetical protein